MTACPAEETSQHPSSPGLVADGEGVCRGAYRPIHFNRNEQIKASFVRPADLLKGELSIWRHERLSSFGVSEVAEELKKSPHTLDRILTTKAGRIRDIRLSSFGDAKVFCVVDDCRTDDQGGAHPAHAVVQMASIEGVDWATDADSFDTAKEALANILRQTTIWQAAA